MVASTENRISQILDEVGRGSSLNNTLGLIADQLAANIGAPICKIWVVKRGDICEHCPLADTCSNRQMCMHLIAASGAVLDREYPRIPLEFFTAPLITRGGTAGFDDPLGVGEKLFGLQRGAPGQSTDSYALYPLHGPSGTVGLIGVFNHRRFRREELRVIEELAPAAVAAIRIAELQARCDSLSRKIERDGSAAPGAADESTTQREGWLEDAVAHLTHQVAELQVERESSVRIAEQLERRNRELQARIDMLIVAHQQSGHEASAMAYEVESERRRLEEENAQIKERYAALEASNSDLGRSRDRSIEEVAARSQQIEQLKVHLGALQERNSALEVTNVMLRGEIASLADGARDLEHSLRMAEDARSRLEQSSLALEMKATEEIEELQRLRVEKSRAVGENEQLVAENELLNIEISRLQGGGTRITEDNARLLVLNAELTQANSLALSRVGELEQGHAVLQAQLEEARGLVEGRLVDLERENERLTQNRAQFENESARMTARVLELEQENHGLTESHIQLQGLVAQFESLSNRLEDSVLKLRSRAEASEAARGEAEQRVRVLAEQNRRLSLDGQTKARFLANMSHELRTPMNAIIGFTSLLLDDRALELNERHRRSLERVSRNARDLLELINNVLDLSKIEAGRMDIYSEPADVRDLIERALAVVEPLREGRPLKLSFTVEDGLPAMRTDRTKLQQILINLLSNAIKFTREGEVKVTAMRAAPERVRISVSDTGVGIAESDIARIFEEFRQIATVGRGNRTGTGLGLAITRRLVDLLGGEISVSSREGEGSSFEVTLPFEIEGRAAPAGELEAPLVDPERTALVIDTDPASLYLTKKYLTEAGYSVAATDDLARGVEIAAKAKPAVITIDLDALDGDAGAIERMANSHKEGFIVALSTDPGAEGRAMKSGAKSFLRKPVERAGLIAILERTKSASRKCVLVVDDDPDALDLSVAMMQNAGYQIQTATTGRQALDAIERQRPDAMILDLMLPEMDGFEIVHRLSLNPEWRTIPVILLTARDLSHEERRALDIGTVRIIQKGSFNRDELLAEMGVALGTAEPTLA